MTPPPTTSPEPASPPLTEESAGQPLPASTEELLGAERDIRAKLAGQTFDFDAAQAIQNIYRAASAVRARAERELLAPEHLSWGGFTLLWVLWVWGPMDSTSLAAECGVAKGTLTGMVTTLERRKLVKRARSKVDRRRIQVALTARGDKVISRTYPEFNKFEIEFCTGLNLADQQELARLLRQVIRNAEEPERPE